MLPAAAWARSFSLTAPGIPQPEGCGHGFPAGSPQVCHTRLKPWAFSLSSNRVWFGVPKRRGHQDQHYFNCDDIGFPCRSRHKDNGVRTGFSQV